LKRISTAVNIAFSRAKGNYKDGSDIDITLLGKQLTLKTVCALEEALDEL
jgi:predicted nucleotidyltransferase